MFLIGFVTGWLASYGFLIAVVVAGGVVLSLAAKQWLRGE